MSAGEFLNLVEKGVVSFNKKGRVKMNELMPEFKQTLNEFGVDVYPENKIKHNHPYFYGEFKIERCKDDIFIPFNVPSKKNSKIWTGKRLISSKTCMKYEQDSKQYYISNKDKFLNLIKDKTYPIVVGFYLYRKTRQRFDYGNILQAVQDLMVEHGWITDDNSSILKPIPLGFEHNKDCGVLIRII